MYSSQSNTIPSKLLCKVHCCPFSFCVVWSKLFYKRNFLLHTHTHTHTHTISSSYHSAPLKLHIGSQGWDLGSLFQTFMGSPGPVHRPSLDSLASPATTLYDSIFVLSSGRVTSIGPHGEFNWQVRHLGIGQRYA